MILGKGRGVFTSTPIDSRSLLHISPVLIFLPVVATTKAGGDSEVSQGDPYFETLKNYTYSWDAGKSGRQALALGAKKHKLFFKVFTKDFIHTML